MESIFSAFAWLLAVFYSFIPNYGVAIVLLTIAVMLATTPLTLKATRSMMVMQQMQPEIKKIQARYKDDRTKLNEELLKFYKDNEISPMGGCLPLLIQMPVFIVLYQVLRGLTQRVSDEGGPTGWNTGQLATGVSPVEYPQSFHLTQNFDPAYLDHSSQLYTALEGTNTMQAFGMDLALSPSQALSEGLLTALPYLLLIVVVGVTGYVQQKQIQGRNTSDPNPQQQMLMKVMPIILPFISFNLPAGLVLYFAVSNLYRVGQQYWISRSIYGIKGSEGKGSGGKSGGSKAGSSKPKESAKSTKSGDTKPAKSTDKGGGKASVATKERPSRSSTPKSTSTSKPAGGTPTDQPTLQPRARKQKKR